MNYRRTSPAGRRPVAETPDLSSTNPFSHSDTPRREAHRSGHDGYPRGSGREPALTQERDTIPFVDEHNTERVARCNHPREPTIAPDPPHPPPPAIRNDDEHDAQQRRTPSEVCRALIYHICAAIWDSCELLAYAYEHASVFWKTAILIVMGFCIYTLFILIRPFLRWIYR